MEQDLPPRPLAVYLHIPFCLSRCGYCSFFSVPFSLGGLEEYLGYLHSEIDLFEDKAESNLTAKTLYLGGGTPSLLSASDINSLCGRFTIIPEAEVTLEINPIQITPDFLDGLVKTPVNRLSIGIQSMNDGELAFLGRRHRSFQIQDKIKLCRKHGYDNISLDLIYGLPTSDQNSLRENLERIISLEPEHISTYLLTLEEDSPLGRKLVKGEICLPEEENLAAQYETLREKLTEAGFLHYEISNFCRTGKASRHNLTYWRNQAYLGLGASASGWLTPWRYSNPPDLKKYYRMLQEKQIMPDAEDCSLEQIKKDYIMMGLRLLEGIDMKDYLRRFGTDLYTERKTAIDKLRDLNMLETNDDNLRLSNQALFVSNRVIGELL